MKKPLMLITTLLFVIIVLTGVRVAVSNSISTSGLVLGSTQDEIKELQNENMILKEKIYTLSSLSRVSSTAAKLGFVESKTNFALNKALPIALGR